MRTWLKLQRGVLSKFYKIDVDGAWVNITFGWIGAEGGQWKQKKWRSPAEARASAEKLIAEKIKEGYVRSAKNPVLSSQKGVVSTRRLKTTEVALPADLKKLVGKARRWIAPDGLKSLIVIFEWVSLSRGAQIAFISRLFGHCDVEEHYPRLIGHDQETGRIFWNSTKVIPFALANVASRGSFRPVKTPQFDRLFLLDVNERVLAIDVDGTAISAAAPVLVVPNWKMLDVAW